ncbi:MAG: Abi family protein [Muribaculaceae bacterium]|nr:Abi family protein [Muribaculaceae bacterium]
MGRKAKPLQQQIDKLRQRGMRIDDPEKAGHILLEVGWYRMSFYWFPFETRYPDRMNPYHEFRRGTSFEDALMLYAFDFNLRNTLLKPLERIETAFRTYVIYTVSSRYPNIPEWFADPRVVTPVHARQFERAVYAPMRKMNPEIILHHRRFPHDRFAPAWKTLEFLTFGAIFNLYESLLSDSLKLDIARHFGIHSLDTFLSYMEIIRALRNLCAHGNVLYSYRPAAVRVNEISEVSHNSHTPQLPRNLAGAMKVVEHFLGIISNRLLKEFRHNLKDIVATFATQPGTAKVLRHTSGFSL